MAQEADTLVYDRPRLPQWVERFGYPLPPLRGAQEPDEDDEDEDTGDDAGADDAGDDAQNGDDDTDDDGDEDQDSEDDDANEGAEDDEEQDDDRDKRLRKARSEARSLRKRLRKAEADAQGKAKAESDLAASQLEVHRLRAAHEAGLDLDMADRIKGTTPEEITADAEAFAAKTKKSRRRGPSDHDAGRRGTPPSEFDIDAETDPKKVAAWAEKNRRR